jgi:hypothetical protein
VGYPESKPAMRSRRLAAILGHGGTFGWSGALRRAFKVLFTHSPLVFPFLVSERISDSLIGWLWQLGSEGGFLNVRKYTRKHGGL